MRRIAVPFMVAILTVGCVKRHVTGTTLPPDRTCDGNWVAIVNNSTNRIYDLYVGTRLVGTAEPRIVTRTLIDPAFGLVTPTLRESATTRNFEGPRLSPSGMRMVCE